MDASTLLKGQGWRGEGHSLDTTNRGLARPLLVQHKADALGIGNKKHDFSDQWWLTNFDKSLKGVGRPGITSAPTELPRLKGFKYNNLYTNFIKAEIMASTIEKDDPLFGKAFSDTKPMTEDPKEVAQRRSSFSTVGRKVLGLTEEEASQATATTHTRKRKSSDSTRLSRKAKKAKHDTHRVDSRQAVIQDVEGTETRKSKKGTQEDGKAARERKSKDERRARKKLDQAQIAGAGAMWETAVVEAAAEAEPSKKRRRKMATEVPDTSLKQVIMLDAGESSSKKRKRSKSKVVPRDDEVLRDGGAVDASTEAVDAKPVKDKKRKRTKEQRGQAETEMLKSANGATADTEVKKKERKRRRTKHREANNDEAASDAETKTTKKKRKKTEADD